MPPKYEGLLTKVKDFLKALFAWFLVWVRCPIEMPDNLSKDHDIVLWLSRIEDRTRREIWYLIIHLINKTFYIDFQEVAWYKLHGIFLYYSMKISYFRGVQVIPIILIGRPHYMVPDIGS